MLCLDSPFRCKRKSLVYKHQYYFEIRAMKCLVCGKAIDLEGAESKTGETAHGAKEIDPSKGTRQFHDGDWYYFDTLNCRSKFTISPQRYLIPKG